MAILGYNKYIATEPMEKNSISTKVNNAFASIDQVSALTPLKVVYGNQYGTIFEGATVYVHADSFKLPWAKNVYTVDGKKVILVPEDAVLLVKDPNNAVKVFDATEMPNDE